MLERLKIKRDVLQIQLCTNVLIANQTISYKFVFVFGFICQFQLFTRLQYFRCKRMSPAYLFKRWTMFKPARILHLYELSSWMDGTKLRYEYVSITILHSFFL